MEPGFEHTALRGITIKNMIVTIFCTATIVASVMTTYFQLRGVQEIQELRLKMLEDHQKVIDHRIDELQQNKK